MSATATNENVVFLLERTSIDRFLKRIHETLVTGCMYAHSRPSFTLSCYEVKRWWLNQVAEARFSFKEGTDASQHFREANIFELVVSILHSHFERLGFDECVKVELFCFDNGLCDEDDDEDDDDDEGASKRVACRWIANRYYAQRFASQKMD